MRGTVSLEKAVRLRADNQETQGKAMILGNQPSPENFLGASASTNQDSLYHQLGVLILTLEGQPIQISHGWTTIAIPFYGLICQ